MKNLNFLFFICLITNLSAQDIHFSQFYHAAPLMNPALTGVFPEDIRFTGMYRQQWGSVPVPYTTFLGAFDQKFYPGFLKTGFFGLGGNIAYDEQGDSHLSNMQLSLNAAYVQPLNEENFISVGFQLSLAQRSFKEAELTFNNQYNGDVFVPTAATGETFSSLKVAKPDFSAGINYHFQNEDSRTRLDLGAALFHLSKPTFSFYSNGGVPLSLRMPVCGKSFIQVAPKIDLRVYTLFQWQKPYSELVTGSGVRYILSDQPGKNYAVSLLASYRWGDAAIVAGELEFNQWLLGVSYDWNTSPFEVATNGKGGPEFFVQYLITKVKPLKTYKACPIF